jgi:hypothetical protein
MYERSFHDESRALYGFRDYLIKVWLDALQPQPIFIVEGQFTPQPLPPMPDNIREALEGVNTQIARLMQEHIELRERYKARRDHEHHRVTY